MIAKFDNVSQATTAKKPAKKCIVHSEFLFSYFLISVVAEVALSLLVMLPRKAILDMRQFHGKCVMKWTFAGTHTEVQRSLHRNFLGACPGFIYNVPRRGSNSMNTTHLES